MAVYTTTIHSMIENNFDFGLTSYPIFDESYRNALNQKILDHFEFREIGFETVGLFKKFLLRTLNEIMPYYNQLYKSQTIEINPLYTFQTDESANRKLNGNSSNNSESSTTDNTDGRSVFSDTPQGQISIDSIDANTYATSANIDKNSGSSSNNSSGSSEENSTDDFIRHVSGHMGQSESSLLLEYRSTFLNIDMQILSDLESLFMQIY